jgi:diaminopimelate dehydrogenase
MGKNMKIAIVGYGRLGKALEKIILNESEHTLVGVFTRRASKSVATQSQRVYQAEQLYKQNLDIDVLLLSLGSQSDLMSIAPRLCEKYNTADCYDNHNKMQEYLSVMNEYASRTSHVSLSACGWDPGLLSQIRVLFSSVFSIDNTYTYWGRGVSQGHSEAIRSINGVKYAVAYTVPNENSMRLALTGARFKKENLHVRECYVVAFGDTEVIEEKIKNMPDYFLGYKTLVHFISEEEFLKNHREIYHRGRVIASNGYGARATAELCLPSNPDFTARVMLSYLPALKRLSENKCFGAKTPLDIPLSYLIDNLYAYI